MKEIVFTFSSTHTVIAAESALLKEGVKVKVRPLPSAVRAGCGLTLCISPNDFKRAKALLKDSSVAFFEIYELKDGKYTRQKTQ